MQKYVLKLHCDTNDVEMRDIQTKRTFLSKTKLPSSLDKSDFFVGASILLSSRDLKVIDYADGATRTQLESVNERTVCVLSPSLYNQLENVVSLIENDGFTVVDLHSTSFAKGDDSVTTSFAKGDDSVTDACATAELLCIDPEELLRPEPLVKYRSGEPTPLLRYTILYNQRNMPVVVYSVSALPTKSKPLPISFAWIIRLDERQPHWRNVRIASLSHMQSVHDSMELF